MVKIAHLTGGADMDETRQRSFGSAWRDDLRSPNTIFRTSPSPFQVNPVPDSQ
jgi:hypothetical protein